ncbi:MULTISPECIES: hypothetical protein [Ruegeria]|uniref:hypothetical protein n=1 Tax=Ruegeria TaxID=97050 RepID=UPI0013F4F8A9|nr:MULTISPECIES: hypothetical protein [Ruegeria]
MLDVASRGDIVLVEKRYQMRMSMGDITTRELKCHTLPRPETSTIPEAKHFI